MTRYGIITKSGWVCTNRLKYNGGRIVQNMLVMNACVTDFDTTDITKAEKYTHLLYKLDMTRYFLQIVSPEIVSKLIRFCYHIMRYTILSPCVNNKNLIQRIINVQKHNLWLFVFIVSFYVFI